MIRTSTTRIITRRPCSHTARYKIAITPCSPPQTTNPPRQDRTEATIRDRSPLDVPDPGKWPGIFGAIWRSAVALSGCPGPARAELLPNSASARTPGSPDYAPTGSATFATRLRQGGADPAQVQALLGHASIETAARYFHAGNAEQAAVVDRVFD
jgi:hypothetical protein